MSRFGAVCEVKFVSLRKKNILPLPFHQWTQKNTKQENTSLPLGPAKRPPTRGTAATAKLKRSKNWIIFYFRLRSDCATCVCVEEDRSREFGRKSKTGGGFSFFGGAGNMPPSSLSSSSTSGCSKDTPSVFWWFGVRSSRPTPSPRSCAVVVVVVVVVFLSDAERK